MAKDDLADGIKLVIIGITLIVIMVINMLMTGESPAAYLNIILLVAGILCILMSLYSFYEYNLDSTD